LQAYAKSCVTLVLKQSFTKSKLLVFKNLESLVFDVSLSKTGKILVFWQALNREIANCQQNLFLTPFCPSDIFPPRVENMLGYFYIELEIIVKYNMSITVCWMRRNGVMLNDVALEALPQTPNTFLS
jgi:hypothetical protein